MKKKYGLNIAIGLILLFTSLQASANFIARSFNTHTISFNDQHSHTLLETGAFHGAETEHRPAVVLFNAECNVDSNQKGVWVGIDVQIRSQNFNVGVWGDWQTISSSNHALCSSHGSGAPVVRVSTSTHNIASFSHGSGDAMYQIRVQGRLRDGVGEASIDDSSLIVIN